MATGTVKWFSADRGYGLSPQPKAETTSSSTSAAITGEGYRSLIEGAKVEYEVEQGAKRPQARNVMILE